MLMMERSEDLIKEVNRLEEAEGQVRRIFGERNMKKYRLSDTGSRAAA